MSAPQSIADAADAKHSFSDEDLEKYDAYGRTPPRTRLLRKYKEKKGRDKENLSSTAKASPKLGRRIISRRNTMTTMFDELITKADADATDESKRTTNKRSIKLLRGSERDLKLDIGSAVEKHHNGGGGSDAVVITIESCSRFKCLGSRRVASSKSSASSFKPLADKSSSSWSTSSEEVDCATNRIDFHNLLSMLIKMGDRPAADRGPRRPISREEILWQTELKDLIWLELQAYHADRTPVEQDEFLCGARESVGSLLNTIMCYKFRRHNNTDCAGCLSMYCESCMQAQNDALREIEEILIQLEAAESLFPSNRAFGELFPLYECPEFVGRVKAMCLWYNMTRHHRLKLVILGKLLALLEHKDYQWPMHAADSIDSTSPTDSNSSTSSVNDYLLNDRTPVDIYNVSPIVSLVSKKYENHTSPYRKYIENILKTRGLSKSMSFLDKLHTHVLRKAQLTLKKPTDDTIFARIPLDNHDDELRRYGACSPEAQSLGLPSYKAAFLFLSAVPLEVIHEFIRMRLEQKPKNPSPLSVRQLLRELKEGIKIATFQRERILSYIDILDGDCRTNYMRNVEIFDQSLERIFADYLEYMSTWALLQQDSFQKNFFEDEWHFISNIIAHIPHGLHMAGAKFCAILGSMIAIVGSRLTTRIDELSKAIDSKEFYRKQNLFVVCRELQSLFNQERETSMKIIAFAKSLLRSGIPINNVDEFKSSVVALKCTLPKAIEKVQNICDVTTLENLDEVEKTAFVSRYREILMQGYRFGFEFHKEMSEFVPAERRELLARSMIQFAHLWMRFAQERCERGRGKRPRWAHQGLDFLLTVCDPLYTRYLSDAEFEELKRNMDVCISHVIGNTAPSTPDSGFHSASPRPSLELVKFPRSRGSSPSPRPTYKSQRSAGRKTSVEQSSPISEADSPNFRCDCECLEVKIKHSPALRAAAIKAAVLSLDESLEAKLRQHELIGKVVPKEPAGNMGSARHLRKRNVTFSWQRGIKIGQGRFGKVYTAINNDTGEMMAVKEVAIQHYDVSVRKVTEEIKVMEGISHRNLVKYYGVELHKEEMLIFMEFCPEGTLESLVAGTVSGLPELLMRRYTYQLVNGVCVLHEHGIVHRDIKTANIFLTDEGNCLKIGDFGSAVKLKSHVTMPGELKGFVGTQAYMAPEMFMKTTIEGHGRAVDIWSVGCVVVEMASGKRPWSQYDSNYQIMFKVGMGEKPEAPSSLIDEGHDFLDLCFQHDPRKRATAYELLSHDFVKVGDDV